MATGRTIARNSFFLALAHGASKLFSIGLTAIAGRVLGTGGFGLYATGAALVEVGRMVAGSGLDFLVAREVATDPRSASRVASNASAVKLLAGLATYLILLVLAVTLDYPRPVLIVVLVLGSALFLENLSDVVDAVFQGRQQMQYTTRAFTVASAFLFVSGAAALWSGLGLYGYVGCFVASFVLRLGLMVVFAHRLQAAHIRPQEIRRTEIIRMVHAGVPLLGATLLALLFHRMDLLMLGKLVDQSDVGLYAAAVRVIDVVVLLPRVLATAVYPALRRERENGPEAVRRLMIESTRVSLVACSAAGLGVWILGPWALRLILGAAFVPASGALRILSWGIVLQAGSHMVARLLFAIDADRDFLRIAGLSMLCNAGLNLWWIPRLGIEGAAWATLVSYVLSFGLYVLFAARRGYAVPLWPAVLGPAVALLAAAFAMWLGTRAVRAGDLGPGWVAVAMLLAWLAGLVLLRAVGLKDLGRLWEMLKPSSATGPDLDDASR